jgi:hypothetical protein
MDLTFGDLHFEFEILNKLLTLKMTVFKGGLQSDKNTTYK